MSFIVVRFLLDLPRLLTAVLLPVNFIAKISIVIRGFVYVLQPELSGHYVL